MIPHRHTLLRIRLHKCLYLHHTFVFAFVAVVHNSTADLPFGTAFTGDNQQMDRRGHKRTLGDGSASTSYDSVQKRQRSCPERRDFETNIRRAKEIMKKIKSNLREYKYEDSNPSKKLIKYIRKHISNLDHSIKKKTTVGVFGKTGAGKSSLINAVLGGKDLLPSGTLCACTSVIIQVGANITDSNYTAEIEFISKEEWEDELKTLLDVLSKDGEEKDDAMFSTAKEKITALYGEEGLTMTLENLMKNDSFTGITEFLTSKIKIIICENGSELSEEIECYVQHDDSNPGGCYWPVVKSVTIKIPNCKDFLEHVLIVDLPGTGDYNKSRDEMWRLKLRDCSTVWIVSEINRAGSDKAAWEILSNSITDMAQGGECTSISFICTKTDDINPQNYMRSAKLKDEDFQITSQDSERTNKRKTACILHRNDRAKERVKKNFNQQDIVQTHFNCDDDFFTVFTVSSEEFTKEDPILKPEETEIPMLRDLLRKYNSSHTNEMTSHYISGALGILSLIQGSKESDTEMIEESSRLYINLDTNLYNALDHLRKHCALIYNSLEEHLLKGARESEEKCVETAKELIEPKKDGRGFHQTLTALCKNDGFYRSKKGTTDLNTHLAKHMLQHIDKAFSDFFPVQGKATEISLQANIDKFTIIPDDLITQYTASPVLIHMLKFLQTEEMKFKAMLKQEIVKQKKRIYASLHESIKSTMQPCYQSAAAITGPGSMRKRQKMLLNHIDSSKSEIFQKAQKDMCGLVDNTLHFTLEEIKARLLKSMGHSLLNKNTLPYINVTKEIEELKKLSAQV